MSSKAQKIAARQMNDGRYVPLGPDEIQKQRKTVDYAIITQHNRIDMYTNLLYNLALARFTWKGLPPGIDERFVELMLLQQGMVLFFPDTNLRRFMITQSAYQGTINPYFNATSFTPIGQNYSYRELTSKQCVPIWDNLNRTPITNIISLYAKRLAMLDRALDVNIDNLSIPMIVACEEGQKMTLENIIKQKEDGVPAIYTYSAANLDNNFSTFPNTTPYISDKILADKAQIWNEAMSFLGVQNSNTEKKERLLTGEVAAGSEKVNVMRLSFLKARQTACDTIHRLWPLLNIQVEWSDNTSGGILSTREDSEDDEL